MLVEHAERFGLSQLHQLRGRVGRGPHQSYCVLLYQSPLTEQGRERLKALTDTTDGFEIAERDLAAARPGRLLRHAPVGHADAARRRPAARSPADGRGAPRSRRRARRSAAGGDARRVRATPAGSSGSGWSGLGSWLRVAGPDSRSSQSGTDWTWRLSIDMRIIAGTLKGRRLEAPDWDGLRPTSDQLRETLFNMLAPRDRAARACSTAMRAPGAVGIEALSRGAAHVTFVERDPRAAALIEANLRRCGVTDRYAIIRAGFADAAARLGGRRSTSSSSIRRTARTQLAERARRRRRRWSAPATRAGRRAREARPRRPSRRDSG